MRQSKKLNTKMIFTVVVFILLITSLACGASSVSGLLGAEDESSPPSGEAENPAATEPSPAQNSQAETEEAPLATDEPQATAELEIATQPGLIAFAMAEVADDQESGEIFTIDTQGQNLRNLTNMRGRDITPDWSPDSSQIVWTSERNNNFEIYVMDADGSNPTRLTDNDATDTVPHWSPDGQAIVFASNRDENWEIYMMDADGANQHNLTENPARDFLPDFSPDGTQVLFVSDRQDNRDIFVMDSDGGNVTQLTDNPADDDDPRWSPDGTQIVFTSTRDGNEEIYVMNADGSNPRRLTDDLPQDSQPIWSPGGNSIIWLSNRAGADEIYIMDAGGSNFRRLDYIPAGASRLDVQPVSGPIDFGGQPVEAQITYQDLSPSVLTINFFDDVTVYDGDQEYKGNSVDIILDPDQVRLPEGEQVDEDYFVIAQPEYTSIFSVLRTSPFDESPTLHVTTRTQLPEGAVLNILPGQIELIDTGNSPAFFLDLSGQIIAAAPDPSASDSLVVEAEPVTTTDIPIPLEPEITITNGVEGFNGSSHFIGSNVELTFDPDQVKFLYSPIHKEKYSITGAEPVPIFQVYRTDDPLDDSDPYVLLVKAEIEIPPDAVLHIEAGEVQVTQADGSLISGPISVELPLTAVVAPTPVPAATPAPATTTQGPPLNAEQYLLTALPTALQMAQAADAMQRLINQPQIGDESWTQSIGVQAGIIVIQYDKLAKLNPPSDLQEAHTSLLAGTGDCNAAALEVGKNLNDLNQDVLNSASASIKTCGQKIVKATELIKSYVTQ